MMGLMIEQMRTCHMRCFNVVPALIVCVRECPAPKVRIYVLEVCLNSYIFLRSCISQGGKIVVENSIKRRGRAFSAHEQSQPSPVAQENVVQQPMNATERTCAFPPIFAIVQSRALCKKPFVRYAVVPGQHLKMSR